MFVLFPNFDYSLTIPIVPKSYKKAMFTQSLAEIAVVDY